jgi:hypothetical protein
MDPVVNNPAATPNPAAPVATPDPNLLRDAGKDVTQDPSILSDAQKQAQEATAAEEKRILEADLTTLNDADKTKRVGLEKAKEDKRLLETPKEQLSAEDQVKQAELLKAKEAAGKANKVPEKYEFKIPEGMTLDQAFVDKVTPIFKKHNVTQAAAQEIADVYIADMKVKADAQAASFKQMLKDSYDETVKELSKDGKNYKEQLVYVAKVRDKLLSKETCELLDATGLSNEKSFILDLIAIGKLISEDKLPAGTSAPGVTVSAAKAMYPNQEKT